MNADQRVEVGGTALGADGPSGGGRTRNPAAGAMGYAMDVATYAVPVIDG